MTNSKHGFITKLKLLFFFFCLIILAFTVAVNFILAKNKSLITQTLNKHFFKPIGIENIFYLPPNIIMVRNFSLSENKTTPDKKLLNIALSYTSFSLSELTRNKALRISSLTGLGLAVKSSDFLSFLKDNFTKLFDFITGLPKQDFKLSLRQIRFEPGGNSVYPAGTKGSLNLEVKKQVVSASGSAGKDTFSFKGVLSGRQIIIENLKLDGGYLNGQFWGGLSSDLAELKGFILINNLNPVKKTAAKKLFILDIDSRIKFAFPHVEIERLNFSLNNNPVKLTARMLFSNAFSCDFKLLSDFRGLDNQSDSRLKRISLLASLSSQGKNSIKLNGELDINFTEYKKDFLPLEKLRIRVQDLFFSLREPLVFQISASVLNLFSKTSANLYTVNLTDLKCKAYQFDNGIRPIRFSAQFYGGRLDGRAKIEMRDFFPVISAAVRVKDVDANKLENLLIHFSKVYGQLSSQIFFINYPQLIFNGTAYLHEGYLNDFEFLKWLAKLFDLPSLKKVAFNKASSNFIVDKDGAEIHNMRLDSENLKIDGNFKLKEADMVASRISLSIRKKLLRESAKFNALLNFLATKQDWIKFNFQLSGNLHKMNFQWLKSDFKDELQRGMPNFVQRNLEKKLESMIESISNE